MVELPDWLSTLSVFQKSAQNARHLIHCLKSRHLIRGYNLTHILQWICFHIKQPSFFKSLASDPNFRKSPEIRRFLAFIYLSLTSRLQSPHGTIRADWCQNRLLYAETYHINSGTGRSLLKIHFHTLDQFPHTLNIFLTRYDFWQPYQGLVYCSIRETVDTHPLLLYKAHALIYFSALVLCHCHNLIETIALFICV